MARIEVAMPQMGESIAEGTVSKWLKKVGDTVQRDEPILEISTDKVDAEIPAPQAGTLTEVVVREGETVEVGTVVAYIDTDHGVASAKTSAPPAKGGTPATASPAPASAPASSAAPPAAATPPPAPRASEPAPKMAAEAPSRAASPPVAPSSSESPTGEDPVRQRSTPLVRRMAEEHGVDLSALEGKGSGHAGRVTKQDLLQYLGREPESPPAPSAGSAGSTTAGPSPERTKEKGAPVRSGEVPAVSGSPVAPSEFWKTFFGPVQHPEYPVRAGDEVEAMDKIRRLTAEHMVLAKRVAPHVHSFIEVDFTRVDQLRKANAEKWKEQGAKVSFTAFVVWALSRTLRDFPMLNATASGNNIIYRGHVNIGVAVDLDPGLIVPVIRDADDLSLVGIGKKVVDLAERARSRKLGPDEIQGATFSITNPGVLGTLVGMPIIPKGTSGILGTGAIEKRVVVVEDPATGADTISIRKRAIFSLGYDHRIVDGADAARFLSRLKKTFEEFPDDA